MLAESYSFSYGYSNSHCILVSYSLDGFSYAILSDQLALFKMLFNIAYHRMC